MCTLLFRKFPFVVLSNFLYFIFGYGIVLCFVLWPFPFFLLRFFSSTRSRKFFGANSEKAGSDIYLPYSRSCLILSFATKAPRQWVALIFDCIVGTLIQIRNDLYLYLSFIFFINEKYPKKLKITLPYK